MVMTNFGPHAPADLRQRWIERWRKQAVSDVREIMRSLTRRESLLDRLGEIGVPALVAYGDEDGFALRLDEVEAMVEALPRVTEFARIPGAGHTPTLEQPEATTAAIMRFLDAFS